MSSNYGTLPTGFARKPLSVILAEIEASMITEFGPGVIQTAQSPLGQINGLLADFAAELWERAEDIYQSYDPDQAEGTRLDALGRIRLVRRGSGDDGEYRKAITNAGQARIDVQDLSRAVGGLAGVTFHQVFVNDSFETDVYGLERGTVAIAVIGGDDQELAKTIRTYIAPGINTFGNTEVSSEIEGFCRSVNIIRPIVVDFQLAVTVEMKRDNKGCPPPSLVAVAQAIADDWESTRYNGLGIDHYTIRTLIEKRFTNVELVSVAPVRINEPLIEAAESGLVNFTEIAAISAANVTVTNA